MLCAAHAAGRLGHSWLLTGEAGIGKLEFAYWLVRMRWCQAQRERPCGDCRSCRQVDTGNHPDLVLVRRDPPPEADPQGLGSKHEITVGQVRELVLAGLSLRAVEGGGRVVIVDSADDLNEESQNALLKLLEEPPPGSLLILVTARAESLLDTVRSRCQEIRLAPLSEQEMAAAVSGHTERLCRLARGRPGCLEQLARLDVDGLLAALDGFLAGSCSGPGLARSLESILTAAGAEGAEELSARRLTLEVLHQRIHDLALLQAGGVGEGPSGRLSLEADLPPIDRLFDMETALMSALTDIRRHLPAAVSLTALGTEFERARMGAGPAGKRYT